MTRVHRALEGRSIAVVRAVGAAYVVVAVALMLKVIVLDEITLGGAIIEVLLVALPGGVLYGWSYWVSESGLLEEMYPRIVTWACGGFGVMLAIIGLVELSSTGGLDRPIFSTLLATSLGTISGLGIGTYESRAISRALEAERHRDELRRDRERLAAINHLNAVVRDINQRLTEQSSRAEIERLVCERLADSESYAFAWVGTVDAKTNEVVPSTAVGVGDYLEGVTITTESDDETGQGPTGAAVRTGEIQVARNVDSDPEYEPWREDAKRRGIGSSAAVPIGHEDQFYGVLNVYTEREDAFDGEEQAVVSQLGEIMGLAMTAIERERAIRDRETRYRTLAENVPNGSVVLFDTDLRYQAAAGTIYDRLPVNPEDLLGTRVGELDGIPSSVADRMERAYRTALDGDTENVQVELAGRVFDVQVIPIRDEDGEITGGLTLSQDVTERRALRRTYRDIFDNVADGLVVHDPETGEILDVNEQFCQMNGYDRETLLEADVGLFSADEPEYSVERAQALVERAREAGPQLFEWRNERADGTTYPVEVHLSTVQIEGEARVLGSVRDVTVRKERERELEYERERLEFVNRLVRHNILNDLNNVQARVDLLEPYVDDAAAEHLETIEKRTDDMVDLVTTLRSLMQIIVTEADHQPERVDLEAILEAEIEDARRAFESATFTVDGDLVDASAVWADDLLGEVFENLFVNAVQHADHEEPHEEPHVTIAASNDGETAVVRVADDGPGVSDPEKKQIFEKGEKDFQSSGTGFGLYLCREIVEGYGGTISVADNDPTGAVFTVELPAAE